MQRKCFFPCVVITLLWLGGQEAVLAQKRSPDSPTSKYVREFNNYTGYFDCYYNSKEDKYFLLITKWNTDFLYAESLTAAIGSNDIGLDRNQLGNQRIVRFERHGPKVFLIEQNNFYRAVTNNQAEKNAVKESFAESVLFGFKILAEDANGDVLIDLTDFLMQDAHEVADRLRGAGEGSFSVDPQRSSFYLPGSKNFPFNSEFETTLTFAGDATGKYLPTVSPSRKSFTVREHHSFVQLPDDQYTPRTFDPRAGYWNISWYDYAKPFTEPLEQRVISRHRLKKKDPTAAMSEPVKPIIYYVDPGAPAPVRQALIEGASWWNQAFEAAGYKNAFRVEVLPDEADPMDIRYNVINWVHRSTRGWSYGGSVTDPRTGEIIKGNVSLGSLRDRQDFLIAEGLLAPYDGNQPIPKTLEEMTLQRLKQLAAHEVGHTLGLSHSYTSSTEGMASVMDYPQPQVNLVNGKIDISKPYGNEIGEFDKVSIAFGYQDYPKNTDEIKAGNELILKSLKAGLTFLSDQDARPEGSAHPYAHLWDNGKDIADELAKMLEIRATVLNNFGEKNIRPGAPMALLEEVLVPMYFYHRYQTEAAIKLIGGLNYRYAIKGDGQLITEFIPAAAQKKSFDTILKTISSDALRLPENLLKMIPPRPIGYDRHRELLQGKTDLTFDALGLAESAADMTVGLLLNSARANRMIEYHARENTQPGLEMIMEGLINATIRSAQTAGYEGAIQRTVNAVVINRLARLASDGDASSETKAIVLFKLTQLKATILPTLVAATKQEPWLAHYQYLMNVIQRLEARPEQFKTENKIATPPGSPIGMDNEGCGKW